MENIGKSSTFHICETIHDILPHFMEVYIFFHLRFAEFYVYTSTFHIVEEYIRLFHISLLLKTLKICERLCWVFDLPYLWKNTWCSSEFLFCEKYNYYSTSNICRGLCRGLLLEYIILFYISLLLKHIYFSTFNIYIVFHLSHLWKNTGYCFTFQFAFVKVYLFFQIQYLK